MQCSSMGLLRICVSHMLKSYQFCACGVNCDSYYGCRENRTICLLLTPCCSYWQCEALAVLDLFMIQKQGWVVYICILGHDGVGTLPKSFALPQHFGNKNIIWLKMYCEKHYVHLKVDLNITWKSHPCIGMYSPYRNCISTLLVEMC